MVNSPLCQNGGLKYCFSRRNRRKRRFGGEIIFQETSKLIAYILSMPSRTYEAGLNRSQSCTGRTFEESTLYAEALRESALPDPVTLHRKAAAAAGGPAFHGAVAIPFVAGHDLILFLACSFGVTHRQLLGLYGPSLSIRSICKPRLNPLARAQSTKASEPSSHS